MEFYWVIIALLILAVTLYYGNQVVEENNGNNKKFGAPKSKDEEEKEKEKEIGNVEKYKNLKRLPVGRLTLNEIKDHNGANDKRIFISICGRIFDMSLGYDFYGPNGSYNCFAGGDASFMLAKVSLDEAHKNKKDFDNTPELDEKSQETLCNWLKKFRLKYPVVGRLSEYENVANKSWIDSGLEEKKNTETKKMTCEELKNSKEMLISVAGYIFDVSSAYTVYDGPDADIPNAVGHDITLALIKEEYKGENYNQPLNTVLENAENKQRLKRILKAFHETYSVAARLDAPFDITLEEDDWDIIHSSDAGDT